VISTASSEKKNIVVGSPRAWPMACWCCPRENRVKSGMFSDSVDQNAIMPISDGKKIGQNALPQPSLAGSDRIGPKPCALVTM
jgi:hypothetical protein